MKIYSQAYSCKYLPGSKNVTIVGRVNDASFDLSKTVGAGAVFSLKVGKCKNVN